MKDLNGQKVAILVANGFEQVELTEPKKALDEAGAQTRIVSSSKGNVKGWQHTEWGDELPVDVPLGQQPGHRRALRPGRGAGRPVVRLGKRYPGSATWNRIRAALPEP